MKGWITTLDQLQIYKINYSLPILSRPNLEYLSINLSYLICVFMKNIVEDGYT